MTKNVLFLFILSLFVSCLSDDSKTLSSLEPSKGNLRILATDAPFNFSTVSSAKITVGRIDVAKKDSDERVTVMEAPKTLDLINLKNGLVSSLVDMNLPAGEYSEIRLFIDSATVSLTDGRHFNLTVPSGAQSGLKIFLNPAITVSSTLSSDVLLDFDLSRSFVPQGNADHISGFIFKPVIRVSNLTTAGSIKGIVQTESGTLEGAIITIMKDESTVATAVSESNGFYQVIGLPEGTYMVIVNLDGYESAESLNVGVNAGNESQEDFVLTLIPVPSEPTNTTDSSVNGTEGL